MYSEINIGDEDEVPCGTEANGSTGRRKEREQERSATENLLLDMCRQGLENESLGFDDNFDADSIQIARLAVLLQDALSSGEHSDLLPANRAIHARDLLLTTTVSGLAKLLKTTPPARRRRVKRKLAAVSAGSNWNSSSLESMPVVFGPPLFTAFQVVLLVFNGVVSLWPVIAPLCLISTESFDKICDALIQQVMSGAGSTNPAFSTLFLLTSAALALIGVGFFLTSAISYFFLRWVFYEVVLNRVGWFVFGYWYPQTFVIGGINDDADEDAFSDADFADRRFFPKWGHRHLSVWYVDQINKTWMQFVQIICPCDFMLAFALSGTGAKVGDGVVFGHNSLPDIISSFGFGGYTGPGGDLSLLTVGDGAVVSDQCLFTTYHPSDYVASHLRGAFVEAPIELKKNSQVKTSTSIGPGCVLEENACLDIGGALFFDIVPPNRIYAGVPAVDSGRQRTFPALRRADHISDAPVSKIVHRVLFMISGVGLYLGVPLLCSACILALGVYFWTPVILPIWQFFRICLFIPVEVELQALLGDGISAGHFVGTSAVLAFLILLACSFGALLFAVVYEVFTIFILLVVRLIDANGFFGVSFGARPGVFEVSTIRVLLTTWKTIWLDLLQSGSDNRFFGPYYLALAGLRFDGYLGRSFLGKHLHLVPDLGLVGENNFWAAGAVSGQVDYDHCVVGEEVVPVSRFQRTRYPTSFFVGNNATIGPNNYATNLLVGVSTPVPRVHGASQRQMQSRLDPHHRTLFGNPALTLGSSGRNKAKSSGADSGKPGNAAFDDSDEADIHDPPFSAYARAVLLVDLVGQLIAGFSVVLVPILLLFAFFHLAGVPDPVFAHQYHGASSRSNAQGICIALLLISALVQILTTFVLLPLLFAAERKVLLGPDRPRGVHKLFHWEVWVLWALWNGWAPFGTHIQSTLRGTLLLNSFFRLLGAEIGHGTLFAGGGLIPLLDLGKLHVGAETVVFNVRGLQLHTFENWRHS